ncbi:hypothetical protein GCM10022207_67700 [Streptomyces lannensis]|uniref:Transposase n=1 Tax=Streptomyces lannensis TaxID=766498 RepID=A0ABP7KYU8_9ACTN
MLASRGILHLPSLDQTCNGCSARPGEIQHPHGDRLRPDGMTHETLGRHLLARGQQITEATSQTLLRWPTQHRGHRGVEIAYDTVQRQKGRRVMLSKEFV